MSFVDKANKKRSRAGIAMVCCLAAGAAVADDIRGEDELVCTAWHATSCSTENPCEATEAWRLNLPDFVKIDLDASVMSSTERNEEARVTEIQTVARSESHLFLNGSQEDRGFSWAINQETGEGTLAIVSDTTIISLFTVCAAIDNLD